MIRDGDARRPSNLASQSLNRLRELLNLTLLLRDLLLQLLYQCIFKVCIEAIRKLVS